MKQLKTLSVLLVLAALVTGCSQQAPEAEASLPAGPAQASAAYLDEATPQQADAPGSAEQFMADCFNRDAAALVAWLEEEAVYADTDEEGYALYALPYQLGGIQGLLVANTYNGTLVSCGFEARGMELAGFTQTLRLFEPLGITGWMAHDAATDSDAEVDIDALQIEGGVAFLFAPMQYNTASYRVSVSINDTEQALPEDVFTEYLGSVGPALMVAVVKVD